MPIFTPGGGSGSIVAAITHRGFRYRSESNLDSENACGHTGQEKQDHKETFYGRSFHFVLSFLIFLFSRAIKNHRRGGMPYSYLFPSPVLSHPAEKRQRVRSFMD